MTEQAENERKVTPEIFFGYLQLLQKKKEMRDMGRPRTKGVGTC
jgi:hypothetical protein